jgi:uncharacterized Zn-finger protein
MADKFFINFRHNIISGQGVKIEKSIGVRDCYDYVINVKEDITHEKVVIEPTKFRQDKLHGPATCLSSRRIMYPCSRNKCRLPCPCLICRKKHPTCQVPSDQACDCQDCLVQFRDHSSFHGAFHLGCKYCLQLVNIFPQFNFFFLNMKREKFNPAGHYPDGVVERYFELPPGQKHTLEFANNWREKLHNWQYNIEDDSIWCIFCNTLISSLDHLKQHLLMKHLASSKVFIHHYANCKEEAAPTLLNCFQCSQNFPTRRDLQRHINSVHYKQCFECPICSMKFSRLDNFERHKRNKHKDSKNTCNVCDTSFKTRDALVRHLEKEEHPIMQCKQCDKSFTRKHDLERHVTSCNPEGHSSLRCELCGTTFTRKSDLDRHSKNRVNIDGTAKYVCDKCNEQLCNRTQFVVHCQSKHRDKEGSFKCYQCSTSYATDSDLKKHKGAVHFDETYKCEHCDKTFSSHANLKRHKVIYKTFKYSCNECNNKFCTGSLLWAHQDSDHGQFSCSTCGQSFTLKLQLEYHDKRRISFSCEDCGKLFCNKKSISAHMNDVHENIFVSK